MSWNVINWALKQCTESDDMEAPHWSPAAFVDAARLAADDFTLWVDVVEVCVTV